MQVDDNWPLYNSTTHQFSNCGFKEIQVDEHYKIVQLKINTNTNVANVVDMAIWFRVWFLIGGYGEIFVGRDQPFKLSSPCCYV